MLIQALDQFKIELTLEQKKNQKIKNWILWSHGKNIELYKSALSIKNTMKITYAILNFLVVTLEKSKNELN